MIATAADCNKHIIFCVQYSVYFYHVLGTTQASLHSALDCLLKVGRGSPYQALH